MKILVFVEKFMSPTLTFVYNEITELAKYHEVKVLCTERINEEKFPFKNTTVIPFKLNIIRRKFVWHGEKTETFMSRKNVKFGVAVRKLISEFKPDVIHGHFGYESIKLLDNIDITDTPMFISFHGYDASQMLNRQAYVNKLNEYFSRKNITALYVSEFIKRNLVNANVNMSNSELLFYGINTDFFNPELRTEVDNDVFTFLQISAFNEKKGHIYTLRAFKLFLDTVDDKKKYKLVLAGGLSLYEQMKAESVLMGLSDNVEFVGPVDHNEAKKLLLTANVFLHHSITASNGDTEGMPNALMEAMAMELPILSTWHAGIPELVEDEVNGYLVEEKDIVFYAKRMKDILSWPYQTKNREKILLHFSNQAHYQTLNNIYQKYTSQPLEERMLNFNKQI